MKLNNEFRIGLRFPCWRRKLLLSILCWTAGVALPVLLASLAMLAAGHRPIDGNPILVVLRVAGFCLFVGATLRLLSELRFRALYLEKGRLWAEGYIGVAKLPINPNSVRTLSYQVQENFALIKIDVREHRFSDELVCASRFPSKDEFYSAIVAFERQCTGATQL